MLSSEPYLCALCPWDTLLQSKVLPSPSLALHSSVLSWWSCRLAMILPLDALRSELALCIDLCVPQIPCYWGACCCVAAWPYVDLREATWVIYFTNLQLQPPPFFLLSCSLQELCRLPPSSIASHYHYSIPLSYPFSSSSFPSFSFSSQV